MKKITFLTLVLAIFSLGWLSRVRPVAAQTPSPYLSIVSAVELEGDEVALEASATDQASAEATPATHSATIINPLARQQLLERRDRDLTESTSNTNDELAEYLLSKPQEKITWHNFLQSWMRQAINNGLPSNLIVLLILFPMVAALIAFSRHILGLRGFGIYTPAVLSIAFLSTGIGLGIAMFVFIVASSIICQKLLQRVNLAHLPKSALILWGVCLSTIGFLIIMAYLNVNSFYVLTIFPLLIIISLSENYTSMQLQTTTKEAVKLTLETVILAVAAELIISSKSIQYFVIVNPELCLLIVFILNILIGRYNGLRLSELFRFQALIKKE
jgi:hypothetical protein